MHQPTRLLALSLLIYLPAVAYGAPDPKFPKLRDIATSFETNVEFTDQNQKTTALAKEFYDFNDKTGRLDLLAVGHKVSYFVYENTDQVFTVYSETCVEDDGGIFELDLFYGWTNKIPLFVGPSALILMAETNSPAFIKTSSVRGILCNQFRVEKEEKTEKLVIDYYFSDPAWTLPFETARSFPVRIEVTYSANNSYADELIDFVYFRPGFNDKAKFQPPVGLGCRGKEPKVDLPALPHQYTFEAENFDMLHEELHAETDVTSHTLWYDKRLKIARLDMYTADGFVSDVFDFCTGVRYHSHDHKTCRFRPMRNSIFLRFEPDSLVGNMKEPEEVLLLDGEKDFYSMGEAEVRGVKCQVFEKAETNKFFRDVHYNMFVTTVYFTTERTKIQVDGESIDSAVPVSLRVTGYGDDDEVLFKRQFHIFSFNDEPTRELYSTYPIETCFPKTNQKSHFVIIVQASEDIATKIEGENSVFTDLAKNEILKAANITYIRLPFVKVDYRLSGIYITGLMLDKPPSLAQFWKEFDEPVDTGTISAFEIADEAKDEESCATACLNLSEKCRGFHFCGEVCFMNKGDIGDTPVDNIPIGAKCYIYIRAVLDSDNNQATLEKALKNLVAAKDAGKLLFRIPSPDGKDGDVLPAIEVITSFDNRGGDDVNDYPYTLVKAGYQFKADAVTTVEVEGADSEEECYRQCKDATTVSCASFSYCYKAVNKVCRITSVLLGAGPKDNDEIEPNENCDIFSLLYLELFELYPGRVFVIPGEKSLTDVLSAEECAKSCKEENMKEDASFTCRGFEYCKSKSSCVLHSKHVLDLKPEESLPAKSECIHYAAKFSADYRNKGALLIDDESNVRNDITLEECSRACSEELFNCSSFNYCPPTQFGMTDSSCSFTSKTLLDNVPKKRKEKCRLYTKREHVEDWKREEEEYEEKKSQKGGYTKSGFTGLLIGMIVLGLIIGALLFVAYSYYRTRSGGDGLTVKFTKQENI